MPFVLSIYVRRGLAGQAFIQMMLITKKIVRRMHRSYDAQGTPASGTIVSAHSLDRYGVPPDGVQPD